MLKGRIIIVMPAFNAAKTLFNVFELIPEDLKKDVILIDDFSVDETVKAAKKLGIKTIKHPANSGYGANQKTSYKQALKRGAEIIVMLHPDGQYNPKDIPRLIKPLIEKKADFVFGSRFKNNDPRSQGMPAFRFYGNKILTFIQNLILETNFSELHSGLRAYNRKLLTSIPFNSFSDNHLFDSQLIAFAIVHKFKVAEVPIKASYNQFRSSIGVLRSLIYIYQAIVDTIKIKFFSLDYPRG
jgi:glycosyltransferase involved in cell wall biosynthesis